LPYASTAASPTFADLLLLLNGTSLAIVCLLACQGDRQVVVVVW
jgi:hypothetical protein